MKNEMSISASSVAGSLWSITKLFVVIVIALVAYDATKTMDMTEVFNNSINAVRVSLIETLQTENERFELQETKARVASQEVMLEVAAQQYDMLASIHRETVNENLVLKANLENALVPEATVSEVFKAHAPKTSRAVEAVKDTSVSFWESLKSGTTRGVENIKNFYGING